jgi:Uma2 family endonuclease
MLSTVEITNSASVCNEKIPSALIYEEWKGVPIYYKGYKDVLAGKKTIEEIIYSTDLQGVLVALINGFLGISINRKKYLIATNEIGLHLAKNDNLANDIVIFEKEKIGKLKGKFFDVAPKIVIEVDIKAEVSSFQNEETNYILQKSQKMLDFGTEKVVWILTDSQKIFVIDQNETKWYVVNWSENIPVLDGCVLNVKQLLEEEDIHY